MSQVSSADGRKMAQIIEVVKTPLAFYALVVLVIEAGFGIFALNTEGPDKTLLIGGMLGLLFLLIISVLYHSYRRPEALFGKRYQESAFQFELFDQKVALSSKELKSLEQEIDSSTSEIISGEFELGVLPYAHNIQIEKYVSKLLIFQELFKFDYYKIKKLSILHLLGGYYYITDNLSLSKKYYEKALKLNKNDSVAINCLGIIYQREDKYDLALNCFNKLIDTNKEKGWGFLGKGVTLKKMGKSQQFHFVIDDAIREFEKAVRKNRHDYLSCFGLASAYRTKDEFRHSEKFLNKVLIIKPDLAPAYYNRAIDKLKQKKAIESVISDLRNALRYHPELIKSVKRDPHFSSLRENKCYKCLIG